MASRMRQARDRQRESLALIDSNPGKSVANIIRHRSSSKRGHELPPLLNDTKVSLTDDTDKAELFSASYAKRPNKELPTPSVSDILFSEGIVRRQLEALNESKSPGPDEIPSKLLKELASELSVPMSMLFRTSFDTGTLPIDWKLAHITPLHKGDQNEDPNRIEKMTPVDVVPTPELQQ
nr:unnamed protein product [Spirometra erinaceieuropaei]